MVQAPGVRVPFADAQKIRLQLAAEGTLRMDLHPLREADGIVFPISGDGDVFDFAPRTQRAASYQELLPDDLQADAPRAFEALGDIAIVKVPKDQWEHRAAYGAALQEFLSARAVFHDNGVVGTYRVRDLERIAGVGDSATTIQENGVRLHVDVAKAYFSPRLADERGRIATLIGPGERVVDMFGGVAPLGVQLARAGAEVTSNDLNPEAHRMAQLNAAANGVVVDLRCGDARDLAESIDGADRIIMNLPHGAADFLPEAVQMLRPGGTIHLHEILADADLPSRQAELAEVGHLVGTRHVRNYSAQDSHVCFDIQVNP